MIKPDRVAQDDVNVQSAWLRCNIGIMGDRSRTLFRRFGVSEFPVKDCSYWPTFDRTVSWFRDLVV